MRRLSMFVLLGSLAGCHVGGGGRSGGAFAPSPPPGMAQCSPSAVCLRVIPMQAAPPVPGRLVVLWMPVGDDKRRILPEVGYDGPFFGNERTAVIPYSAIVPPRQLHWVPKCLAIHSMECDRLVGVATGYVFVLPNVGGPPIAIAASKSNTSAVGRIIVGFGTEPIAPGGTLSQVFPAGIAGGLAPYGVVRPQGARHEQAALAPPGTWFDLVTCTQANPRCELPYPNLN